MFSPAFFPFFFFLPTSWFISVVHESGNVGHSVACCSEELDRPPEALSALCLCPWCQFPVGLVPCARALPHGSGSTRGVLSSDVTVCTRDLVQRKCPLCVVPGSAREACTDGQNHGTGPLDSAVSCSGAEPGSTLVQTQKDQDSAHLEGQQRSGNTSE